MENDTREPGPWVLSVFGLVLLITGLFGFFLADVMRHLSDGRIGDIDIAIFGFIIGGVILILIGVLYPIFAQYSGSQQY